jgi:hypothetical protein
MAFRLGIIVIVGAASVIAAASAGGGRKTGELGLVASSSRPARSTLRARVQRLERRAVPGMSGRQRTLTIGRSALGRPIRLRAYGYPQRFGGGRPTLVFARISRQFAPGSAGGGPFPTPDGWCCVR